MTVHDLKCWPEPFQALASGEKTAEFRKDDRGYVVGDILHMREWVPKGQVAQIEPGRYVVALRGAPEGVYTGRTLDLAVTHIIRGPQFGIPEGYCMMSVRKADVLVLPRSHVTTHRNNLEMCGRLLRDAARQSSAVMDAKKWVDATAEHLSDALKDQPGEVQSQ